MYIGVRIYSEFKETLQTQQNFNITQNRIPVSQWPGEYDGCLLAYPVWNINMYKMTLSYSKQKLFPKILGILALVLLPIYLYGLKASFSWDIFQNHVGRFRAAAPVLIVLGSLVLLVLLKRALQGYPPVTIGDEGISDRRLRLRMLEWKAIKSARLYNPFGLSLILLNLYDPEPVTSILPPFQRLMTKWYKSNYLADLYVDLTELDCDPNEILKFVNKQLPDTETLPE